MWALINETSYAAEHNWIRDKQGVHYWLVAVKATFDIDRTGKLKLADEQPPPLQAPEYRGEPATSSLRLDADLAAIKPGTDIILDAWAHAPKGKPTAMVPVSLRVGDLEKTLVVYGTRVYYRAAVGLTMTNPAPFEKSPIHYEFAFGGTDTSHEDPRKHRIDARNPIGRGFTVDPRRLENQQAHSIEYPNRSPEKGGPAGYGPLCSYWTPRLERAGTYDARWERSKKPLLPDDYDDRFALSAPDDQRPARPLHGGEAVTLVNMTPDGVLRFELPKIFLAFRTYFGRRSEEHRANLATVFVDAEATKLSLVWQTSLRVAPRDLDYLDETVIEEKPYVSR